MSGSAKPAAVNINPALATAGHARLHGAYPVVRYGDLELTAAQLDDRVARLAGALRQDGTCAGDRVAYLGMNSPAFLVTMLAAWRIGAVFVPVNYRLSVSELGQVLGRSGAVSIVSESDYQPALDELRSVTRLRRYFLVDDDVQAPATSMTADPWQSLSSALAAATPVSDVAPAEFDDAALLMFTSGTTGLPKGVVLTHGNLWWNAVNVDSRIDTRRGDVTYAVAPLFHIGALNSFVIRTLVRGGTVVLRRSFEPQQFLADLAAHEVNSLFAVPVMLDAVSRLPELRTADLPALRSVVVGGAPVPPALIRKFADRGIWLQQAWGLTETAPFATHLPVERTLDKLGSAGIPMPHTEVQVIDVTTHQPVGPGVPGEILVRGPNVSPGYWENPGATAAAFDDSGWFHSGDIGYFDDAGFLFIVDRLKDMVISGGENVYPAEVELVLLEMPGVNDVAVIGMPDAKWGEAVVAVFSAPLGTHITPEEVRAFASSKLARYKLPQRVHVVDRLPRNAAGKLLKHQIRKMLDDAADDR